MGPFLPPPPDLGSLRAACLALSRLKPSPFLAHDAQRRTPVRAPEDQLQGPTGDSSNEDFKRCLWSFCKPPCITAKQNETKEEPKKRKQLVNFFSRLQRSVTTYFYSRYLQLMQLQQGLCSRFLQHYSTLASADLRPQVSRALNTPLTLPTKTATTSVQQSHSAESPLGFSMWVSRLHS